MRTKELRVLISGIGAIRVFTKEAYQSFYGRDPQADNLSPPEQWTSPDGRSLQVYKARLVLSTLGHEAILAHAFSQQLQPLAFI